ncbi:RNA polymerase sigma factor [Lampropedia puyangensis]|uniref:RNA polymerase sigma factor n=1 Tax=Lampropedia puyangensis TaxID=1330072 RepID=A0A4S8EWX3_9BURK|nr:RNA polymerase sigma factor [Lampropedia puyangensis]THT99018.1 RNA polymerase sigma factor [Lampropedia puyangensis]
MNEQKHDGAVATELEAISVCFEQMYPKLRRFFEAKTGNIDDAVDLTQQLWLHMYEKAKQGNMLKNQEAYIFGSAHNLLKDFWRSEQRRMQLDGALFDVQRVPELAPDAADCASSRELLGRVQAVLQTFPQRTREVYIAHTVLGATKQELAQQYGVDRSTIDRCLCRVADVVEQLRVRHRDRFHDSALPPATTFLPQAMNSYLNKMGLERKTTL